MKKLNPTTYLLITWNDNWADEMDLQGFCVMTVNNWDNFKESAKLVFEKRHRTEFHVGTNESIEYESYENFIGNFTTNRIDSNQIRYFKKVFGTYGFGFFPDLRDEAADIRREEQVENGQIQ